MDKINVLSLFGGMEVGYMACFDAGLKVNAYYSCEIDKFCNQQTKHNFKNIIQLGDVTKLNVKDLPKIDLLIGGSPCQGFSFAGKQLAFDDPRSLLFFEFVRIKNELEKINPDLLFMLENVNMKKEYLRIISEYVGIFPVNINSNLVSAQNRNRWYWSNIRTKKVGLFEELYTDIPQPKDKGILLKDILEKEVDKKYYLSDLAINRMIRKEYSKPKINPEKAGTLNTKNNSGQCSFDSGTSLIRIDINGKAPTQRSSSGRCLDKKHNYQFIGIKKQKDTLHEIKKATCLDANYFKGLDNHQARTGVLENNYRIRRLTVLECSRLQTIPEDYEFIVSNSQAYKMLGNGWTMKVISHILSFLPLNND